MKSRPGSVRNKLMLACALTVAAVLAAPAAMARDYHRGHRDDSGKVLGALVVGAVIGGVIASASQSSHTYYDGGYYYPPQSYPAQGYYYQSYPSYPSYPTYPAYSYGGAGYGYPGYGYGSRVNVGVVYNSGGSHWRGRSWRHDGRHGYYRGDGRYDGRGQYYRRHDH